MSYYYIYDRSGKLTKTEIKDRGGNIFQYIEHKYEDNNTRKDLYYYENGDYDAMTKYSFDDNGNIIYVETDSSKYKQYNDISNKYLMIESGPFCRNRRNEY